MAYAEEMIQKGEALRGHRKSLSDSPDDLSAETNTSR